MTRSFLEHTGPKTSLQLQGEDDGKVTPRLLLPRSSLPASVTLLGL